MKKTTIYGVLHTPKNLEKVLEIIIPQINPETRIGFEVPNSQIGIYDMLNMCQGEELEELKEAITKRYVTEQHRSLEAHNFWFNLYNKLKKAGHHKIIGLGSEERIDLLAHYTKENKENYKSNAGVLYHLMKGPHFNPYLAKKMRTREVDTLIVGCAHAPKVAELTNSKLVMINQLDEQFKKIIKSNQETYEKMKHELPELRY